MNPHPEDEPMSAPDTITPSMRVGIHLTPRMPPFQFDSDSLPERWFDGDLAITAAWNALSVIAASGEAQFMSSGRWLLDRIDDPVVAAETRAFVQQEASHSAVHRRFNRCLEERGLPVAALDALAADLFNGMETYGGRSLQVAATLAGEQLIGEMGHAVLERPASMDGAAEGPRALWMWHWYEEVEHQAALHDGWVHVHGQSRDARALRVLGAVYVALVVACVWPAGTWAMLRSTSKAADGESRPWRLAPLLRQLFGQEGLLKPAAKNLIALTRVDFHPFQVHDPVPTLDRWRGRVTDASWERKAPAAGQHGAKRHEVAAARVGSRDVLQFLRFALFSVGRTSAFVRQVR